MAIANALIREMIAEFWGTFFLCMAVVSSAGSGSPLTPVAAGIVLMTQVYSYGYLSGGQYNPAVTTAVTIAKLARGLGTKKEAISRCIGFFTVQFLAGLIAGGIAGSWAETKSPGAFTGFDTSELRTSAWFGEFFFTFMLASSVLHCAVNALYKDTGNQFYGLVIGLSVTGGALSVGAHSGGCFNPAVAFAMDFAERVHWRQSPTPFSYFWLYLTANLLGGACAALNFLAISPTEEQIAEGKATDEDQPLNENYTA